MDLPISNPLLQSSILTRRSWRRRLLQYSSRLMAQKLEDFANSFSPHFQHQKATVLATRARGIKGQGLRIWKDGTRGRSGGCRASRCHESPTGRFERRSPSLNGTRWKERMEQTRNTVVKTTCGMYFSDCGVLVRNDSLPSIIWGSLSVPGFETGFRRSPE